LRQATIVLLFRGDEVLLAMKKRGFGVGKWNGPGGKVKPGEKIMDAAIRETEEEVGVTPVNIKKAAVMRYYFPAQENWGQEVHIFKATEWKGEIGETEEMRPKWFKKSEVPFSSMWADDEVWMPVVFAGKLVTGSFMFEGDKMLEYYVDEVSSFNE
jgi:8-oxo-dGTP pyrophosphatase MutT (NUDIX family)